MLKNLTVAVSSVFLFVVIIFGAWVYHNWYMSLPVVKYTTDGQIVAVEVQGQYYGPEHMEKVGDRYKKDWVSFDWKPE